MGRACGAYLLASFLYRNRRTMFLLHSGCNKSTIEESTVMYGEPPQRRVLVVQVEGADQRALNQKLPAVEVSTKNAVGTRSSRDWPGERIDSGLGTCPLMAVAAKPSCSSCQRRMWGTGANGWQTIRVRPRRGSGKSAWWNERSKNSRREVRT